jgi:prephenate dehydrogenase
MRIAVLGVGLIGGSIGLAARRRLGAEVIGFDPDAATLDRAVELGALDEAAREPEEAAAEAEAVICAAPVGALADLVRTALGAAGPATVVTDVGSTKRTLLERIEGVAGSERFVGGHPLAGAETAGVDGAREDLFEGARWYLTPGPRSQGILFDRLHGMIAGIGARPQAIDAAEHDRRMAAISHLPHVLANVLVGAASTIGGPERPAVGRSFRDATRVAGANPAIWADIYATNSEAVAAEIDAAAERLRTAAELVRGGDRDALASWQEEARENRRQALEADLAASPLLELRVAVENRPGTVAEIALALAGEGVNIEDMSLFPAADQRTGMVSLWIGGRGEAERAAEIVAGLGHKVAPIPASES